MTKNNIRSCLPKTFVPKSTKQINLMKCTFFNKEESGKFFSRKLTQRDK